MPRVPRVLAAILLVVCGFAVGAVAFAPACLADAGEKPSLLKVDVVVAAATVVVFVVLLVVLGKTAWKPIVSGLAAREQAIRDQIEGAERANAEAKAMLAEYEQRVARAADEARSIVEEGRRDAEALKARIESDARTEAGKERDRALRDIELARQQALKDIFDEVASISTDVAGRIIGQRLDPAGHRRLVDEAVTSYERSRRAPGSPA